jgi:hypothetical protein
MAHFRLPENSLQEARLARSTGISADGFGEPAARPVGFAGGCKIIAPAVENFSCGVEYGGNEGLLFPLTELST